jgi:stage V sporulation protein B
MLTFVKPVASALVMSGMVWLSYRILFGFFGNALSAMISILSGVVVYCAMLFVTKSIRKEELKALPKGVKILNLINKIKK